MSESDRESVRLRGVLKDILTIASRGDAITPEMVKTLDMAIGRRIRFKIEQALQIERSRDKVADRRNDLWNAITDFRDATEERNGNPPDPVRVHHAIEDLEEAITAYGDACRQRSDPQR